MEERKEISCPLCGKKIDDEDDAYTLETPDGYKLVCEDCYYEDYGYVRCQECEMLFEEDDIKYADFSFGEVISDGYFCEDCISDISERRRRLGIISIEELPRTSFLATVENMMPSITAVDLWDEEEDAVGKVN